MWDANSFLQRDVPLYGCITIHLCSGELFIKQLAEAEGFGSFKMQMSHISRFT